MSVAAISYHCMILAGIQCSGRPADEHINTRYKHSERSFRQNLRLSLSGLENGRFVCCFLGQPVHVLLTKVAQ